MKDFEKERYQELSTMLFEKIVPSQNAKRFYVLYPVQDTLFDNLYAVRIVYGRIDERKRLFIKIFNDKNAAEKYRHTCYNKRVKHGYEVGAIHELSVQRLEDELPLLELMR